MTSVIEKLKREILDDQKKLKENDDKLKELRNQIIKENEIIKRRVAHKESTVKLMENCRNDPELLDHTKNMLREFSLARIREDHPIDDDLPIAPRTPRTARSRGSSPRSSMNIDDDLMKKLSSEFKKEESVEVKSEEVKSEEVKPTEVKSEEKPNDSNTEEAPAKKLPVPPTSTRARSLSNSSTSLLNVIEQIKKDIEPDDKRKSGGSIDLKKTDSGFKVELKKTGINLSPETEKRE